MAESVDGGKQLVPPLLGEEQHLGRWGRIARGCIPEGAHRQVRAARRAPPAVSRRIAHDPQQPRPKLSAGAEPAERPMRTQEALLGGIAGLIGVADHQVRGAISHLLVAAHELLEGRRIAASGCLDPFVLEQWTALHLCHPYTAAPVAVPRWPAPLWCLTAAAQSLMLQAPHNASVQTVASWIGRRDAVLGVVAAAIGLAIGYVDSRPTWDDTGITVGVILVTSAIVSGLSGRRPWLWALLIGAWVPLFEISGSGGPASLVALLVAAVGATVGYALVRVAEAA
jgi:hypothetical protein